MCSHYHNNLYSTNISEGRHQSNKQSSKDFSFLLKTGLSHDIKGLFLILMWISEWLLSKILKSWRETTWSQTNKKKHVIFNGSSLFSFQFFSGQGQFKRWFHIEAFHVWPRKYQKIKQLLMFKITCFYVII